nr:MAG TPA: hypothetical protein [Caudoviricetes sp.]
MAYIIKAINLSNKSKPFYKIDRHLKTGTRRRIIAPGYTP